MNFLRREIYTTFYEVVNYVRSLLLAKKLYSYVLTTDQNNDFEYYIIQLKLYLLLFDSKISPELLAKNLSCDGELITMETLARIVSTKSKVMSGTLQHRIYYFADIDIEDEMRPFYERCVKVLSRVSEKEYSNILAYKMTDGREKLMQTENQSVLNLKKKISVENFVPAV